MTVEQIPCQCCGQSYLRKNKRQRYCPRCQAIEKQEYRRLYAATYRRKHPIKARQAVKRAWKKNHDYYLKANRKYGYRYRKDVIQKVMGHYSRGTFACACCGESERDFLTIDHIEGKGIKHRTSLFGRPNSGGHMFYRWLIKNGFPSGYAVLCMNCNFSKGKHKVCIHQTRATRRLAGNSTLERRVGSIDNVGSANALVQDHRRFSTAHEPPLGLVSRYYFSGG